MGYTHPWHAEPPPQQATGPRGWVPGRGDPSEGGKMDGAGTQVGGADKMALEKFAKLLKGPNRQ